ncbi:MAG: thiamine pyrophosphate-dependent dehydrogenase E1 component subunit alpha [Candidatus Omnitrophica bacterium]|nr:thiamine pyrophosphate-dependent dehydrogenase E1 component subunit alpha [Candidatus Omnitrophota bacterium]
MKELNITLYKTMYMIRKVEEKIQAHYLENEMKTPMHMSMGEEAIAAGVCHALKPEDQVLGSYRSHGIYIAKVQETDKFFAEMYGKVTGTSQGKAGSMHLLAPEAGLVCTSAIVGSSIPVAIGFAFANKQTKNGRITTVFFGDGAVDEGVFWESLNFACLSKLPVVFICEDNGFAVHSPVSERHGYGSIAEIVRKFDCSVFQSDSSDVQVIYNLTKNALKEMSNNNKPVFLYFKYYRYLEHVGVFDDFKAGYRPKEDFEKWLKVDPVCMQRKKLVRLINEGKVASLEKEIEDRINLSKTRAQQADFPDARIACEDIYI